MREPDASAFSQILECSTADLTETAGDTSAERSAGAASSAVLRPPRPGAASDQAQENEVLDWRDSRQG